MITSFLAIIFDGESSTHAAKYSQGSPADREQKPPKHHYTADFADGSSASLERLEWKPFHPSISIKTADAEFLLEGSSGSGKFTITQQDRVIAKITRPGFVLKYNYALEILDDNLQELVLAAFMVLSHYIGGRRGFVVATG